MTLPLLHALFSHARAQPEAVAWESQDGQTFSYHCLAQILEGYVTDLGEVLPSRVLTPRVTVEEDLTLERFAWVVACMDRNIPALALSGYQASGRFEDLHRLWDAHIHLRSGGGRSHLHHRLDAAASTWSGGVVMDLNHGANLPKLGWVSVTDWTAHWEDLKNRMPVQPGERVASLLPDELGSWLDMCAVVLSQGGQVWTPPLPASLVQDPVCPWPEGVSQIHITAVQALLLDPATVPASAVGWIHGPCPAWVVQKLPWAQVFPSLVPEHIMQWVNGLGASTDILYEFGLDTDPREEWRKEKEQALTLIPGVVAAMVPVHPLRKGDRRPIGVVCLERGPQELYGCKEAVARLCASDPDLALSPVVWMGYQGLGLSSMLERGLVLNALSLAEHMANDLEQREKEGVA